MSMREGKSLPLVHLHPVQTHSHKALAAVREILNKYAHFLATHTSAVSSTRWMH